MRVWNGGFNLEDAEAIHNLKARYAARGLKGMAFGKINRSLFAKAKT